MQALPEATEEPAHLPVFRLQVLTVLEEFRQIALPVLGTKWANSLPRVPLTKEELKQVARTQWERDEYIALRQLADLGSVSAGIITRLELTRQVIQMAKSVLRTERAAQVTLMSILGGTRFETHFHGVLVLTMCPRQKRNGTCRREDSYDHLLWRYWLRDREARGADSLDFLVTMARKAIPPIPGTVRPMCVQRTLRTGQGSNIQPPENAVEQQQRENQAEVRKQEETWYFRKCSKLTL